MKGLEMQVPSRCRATLTLAAILLAQIALAQTPPPPAAPSPATSVAAAPTAESDVRTYRSHIEFLANPFMEGRGPGTRGNEIASEYIEHAFAGLQLGGAFDSDPDKAGQPRQRIVVMQRRQTFVAGTRAELKAATIDAENPTRKDGEFHQGHEFTALGFSASGKVSAPLVFAGYCIEKGGTDGKYTSFPSDGGERPLDGKIAIILRFEPMDDAGKSLWKKKEDTIWSPAAALADKLQAAVKRGAAGIILVSPPGADDPRAGKLETTEGSSRWTRQMDIPVLMMSTEAADALVQARDPQHRSLLALRTLADAGPAVFPLGALSLTITTDIDRSPRTTWNIAATLPGRGPLASQYIIIGAHYDHVGYGYTGGSRSDEYGIVHPGADDNASGASGLLLAAEIMKRKYEAKDTRLGDAGYPEANLRSIMFVAFSAEEMGLIGSREFLKACPIEARNIDAMLNMDMIGRLRDDKLEISGTGTAEGFADLLKPIFDASGLHIQASPGGRGPSDHATFYGAGVPVLHFFTGMHDQYHTPRDTVDLINSEGAVKAVNLVCTIATTLATREQQLAFLSTDKKKNEEDGKPQISLGGVKVRFGIAPGNYADGEAGILVGEVFPGTCAAEAGIVSGDRLIRWNGKEIGDVQGWMEMMGGHKPGDVVDVDVKRKGEELRVRATLKSRDQAPK
jgi:Zn-dependent M28 family amino/carboxypeptidase